MNWSAAFEVARAVYGLGLLLLGGGFALLIARFGRPLLLVVADLSAAIKLASASLRDVAASAETIAKVARQVDEIHAALVPRKDPPQ